MLIVWLDIVARTTWRLARSVDKVNGARKMVNKEVSGFVVRNGGLAIRHMVLEVDTWRLLAERWGTPERCGLWEYRMG